MAPASGKRKRSDDDDGNEHKVSKKEALAAARARAKARVAAWGADKAEGVEHDNSDSESSEEERTPKRRRTSMSPKAAAASSAKKKKKTTTSATKKPSAKKSPVAAQKSPASAAKPTSPKKKETLAEMRARVGREQKALHEDALRQQQEEQAQQQASTPSRSSKDARPSFNSPKPSSAASSKASSKKKSSAAKAKPSSSTKRPPYARLKNDTEAGLHAIRTSLQPKPSRSRRKQPEPAPAAQEEEEEVEEVKPEQHEEVQVVDVDQEEVQVVDVDTSSTSRREWIGAAIGTVLVLLVALGLSYAIDTEVFSGEFVGLKHVIGQQHFNWSRWNLKEIIPKKKPALACFVDSPDVPQDYIVVVDRCANVPLDQRQPCPPHGHCVGGVLDACEGHYDVYDQRCVLNAAANATLAQVVSQLHNWTVEHVCTKEGCEFALETGHVERPFFRYTTLVAQAGVPWDWNLIRDYQHDENSESLFVLEMEGHDEYLIGLHPSQPLHLPLACRIQTTLSSWMHAVAATVWTVIVALLVSAMNIVYEYPKLSLIALGVAWGIHVFLRKRRDLKQLTKDVVHVRTAVVEILATDPDQSHQVLHIRDQVAFEHYNETKKQRQRLVTKVWPVVVSEVQQDNRIRKTCRMDHGQQQRQYWQWVAAEPSSQSKKK